MKLLLTAKREEVWKYDNCGSGEMYLSCSVKELRKRRDSTPNWRLIWKMLGNRGENISSKNRVNHQLFKGLVCVSVCLCVCVCVCVWGPSDDAPSKVGAGYDTCVLHKRSACSQPWAISVVHSLCSYLWRTPNQASITTDLWSVYEMVPWGWKSLLGIKVFVVQAWETVWVQSL